MTKLNPGTRELLARAKMVDGPVLGSEARIYRALTGTAAASAVTLGVTAAETSLNASVTASKLLTLIATGKVGLLASITVGMLSGTLVFAGVEHFVPSKPAPKPAATLRAKSPAKPLSTAPVVATAAVSVSLPPLPVEVEVEKAAPATLASNPAPIAEETRLLAQVQAALREGDGQRSLLLLGRYRRDFVKGALSEEAAAAEVFAHCAVGDVAGAAQARTRFRQQFAGSPLEPRVEGSCANDANPDR